MWKLDGNSITADQYIGVINGNDFKVKIGEQGNLFDRYKTNLLGKHEFSLGGWLNYPKIIFEHESESVAPSYNAGNPIIKMYKPTGMPASCNTDLKEVFPWWISVQNTASSLGTFNISTGAAACEGNESVTPVMSILSNGNVGIGTDEPTTKLDVNGNINAVKLDCSSDITVAGIAKFAQNVGIGTDEPTAKLHIEGASNVINLKVKGIILTEEVRIKPTTDPDWPDYVFCTDYNPMSLDDIEQYIQINKHLPGVPSSKDVNEDGIEIGKMQAILLKKIEELTLHVIELSKENKELKAKINKRSRKK